MNNFRKNVFRLALRNRASLIGAAMIIALGILVFTGMLSSAVCMKNSMDDFFNRSGLADVYVELAGISSQQAKALTDIKGVSKVNGRLAADVRVNRPDSDVIVTVKLIADDPDAEMDKLYLTGDNPAGDAVYIGKHMQKIYQYEIGDSIELVYNGRAQRFRYAGTVQTPSMLEPSLSVAGFVDGTSYDIAAISAESMTAFTGKEGLYTQLSIALENGYSFKDLEQPLRSALNPYGLISIQEQEKQDSIYSVKDAISLMANVGYTFPFLFLAVAVFMLYVIIKKIVDRDRTLIGAMKAFGLSDMEMISAYLVQGAFLGFAGALVGVVLGWPVGKYLFTDSASYYGFPTQSFYIPPVLIAAAFLIAVITGIIASYISVRSILKITPSEAMRPPAPRNVSEIEVPAFIEKETGILGKMAVRATTQNPLNGFLIVFAIAFSVSISASGYGAAKSVDEAIDTYYNTVTEYNLLVNFNEPVHPKNAEESVMKLSHVLDSESEAVYSITLYNQGLSKSSGLIALPEDGSLFIVTDYNGRQFDYSNGGMIIDQRLADYLNVTEGDEIELVIPSLSDLRYKTYVGGIVIQSLGSSNYIGMEALEKLTGVHAAANAVMIRAEEEYADDVLRALQPAGNVVSVGISSNEESKMRSDMMSTKQGCYAIAVFGMIAGIIMVYNISMINLRERTGELGTMLILGRGENDIGRMLFVEQIMYFAVGSALSLVLAKVLRLLLAVLFETDYMFLNIRFSMTEYLIASVCCLVMVCASWQGQVKYVKQIKLTDILKERC